LLFHRLLKQSTITHSLTSPDAEASTPPVINPLPPMVAIQLERGGVRKAAHQVVPIRLILPQT